MYVYVHTTTCRYLVTKRESTLKEEYGLNVPAHLLVPPVGPHQVCHDMGREEAWYKAS